MVEGKTVLITGTNRGIGLELCRQLSQEGADVIGVCRESSSDLDRLDIEVISGIDVTSDACVGKLAEQLSNRKLDWLINNSGVLVRDSLDTLDFGAVEQQFQVNSLGPLRVSMALRHNMRPGGKIFVISSNMGSIADNSSGGYYGYRMSKAAANMAFKNLSVDLEPSRIGVFILHPGWVATEMGGAQAPVPVHESAASLIERMHELQTEDAGTFRHAKGHDLAW